MRSRKASLRRWHLSKNLGKVMSPHDIWEDRFQEREEKNTCWTFGVLKEEQRPNQRCLMQKEQGWRKLKRLTHRCVQLRSAITKVLRQKSELFWLCFSRLMLAAWWESTEVSWGQGQRNHLGGYGAIFQAREDVAWTRLTSAEVGWILDIFEGRTDRICL